MRYSAVVTFAVLVGFVGGMTADAQIVIDHDCRDLGQVPGSWITQAQSDLHTAYQHTSHGSQLITGLNALQAFPPFGDTYRWSDDGSVGLDLDDWGFFKPKDSVMNPIETDIPGMFVCGCCHGPSDIPESVAEASGTAALAAIVDRRHSK